MLDYHWPGNVREREHVISRAAIKALSRGAVRTDIVTLAADLLDLDTAAAHPRQAVSSAAPPMPSTRPPLAIAVVNFQRQYVQMTLQQSAGNWAAAARSLGLDASNLHKLARRLGLKA